MGLVKLVFNEAIDDGPFADILVSDEDDFKFVDVLFGGGVGEFVLAFFHCYKVLCRIYNYKLNVC